MGFQEILILFTPAIFRDSGFYSNRGNLFIFYFFNICLCGLLVCVFAYLCACLFVAWLVSFFLFHRVHM